MGRIRQGYFYILWIGFGVLVSTVLANRLFASGLVSYQVLYRSVQDGWQGILSKSSFAKVQIILTRGVETAVIWFLCKNRNRLAGPVLFFIGGCSLGAAVTMMTWNLGILGLPFFLGTCFPHYLFYLPVWVMLVVQGREGFGGDKNRFFSAVLALMAAGILLEILVNPIFLRLLNG